jgi:MFS family permease
VLEKTGSAAVFGTLLAVSMVPTILLTPFGGVLADRIDRRKIMVGPPGWPCWQRRRPSRTAGASP